MKTHLIPFGILAAILAHPLSAADWPQWRGPNRDGISTEIGWSVSWPKEGLKRVWKAEVGAGYGTVSVSQGRLYVMGNTADKDTVYCLEAGTGKETWKFTYDCVAKDPNGYHGVRSTPSVDGDLVFTTSRQGHLFCLSATEGKVKWAKEFGKDFGGKTPTWGFAISPLVEGGLVIVEPGGPGAAVVALKKETGEEVWKSEGAPAGYSSPIAYTLNRERFVAVFSAQGGAGRRLSDGKAVWNFPWKTSYDVNAATPIVDGSKVFVSSGYGTGCGLYDVATNPPQEVWKNKNMRNHVNSCVLWRGCLYGFDENSLKCIDFKTGEVKWSEGKYGKGSLMLADGKLLLYSERGQLGLAEASPEGYKELGFFQALEVRQSYPGGAARQTWAAPVLANGKIYCRSQDDLVCLEVK
jgi:outer membrane protein assembly factor BamB